MPDLAEVYESVKLFDPDDPNLKKQYEATIASAQDFRGSSFLEMKDSESNKRHICQLEDSYIDDIIASLSDDESGPPTPKRPRPEHPSAQEEQLSFESSDSAMEGGISPHDGSESVGDTSSGLDVDRLELEEDHTLGSIYRALDHMILEFDVKHADEHEEGWLTTHLRDYQILLNRCKMHIGADIPFNLLHSTPISTIAPQTRGSGVPDFDVNDIDSLLKTLWERYRIICDTLRIRKRTNLVSPINTVTVGKFEELKGPPAPPPSPTTEDREMAGERQSYPVFVFDKNYHRFVHSSSDDEDESVEDEYSMNGFGLSGDEEEASWTSSGNGSGEL